ncbi:hypothetical protein PZA11_001354 [Diplocarpon coronariae]|uniref:Uncharacterized protein n=1 Tax=Diplocarpon coronariae TaxID=2795749 RepID=A0A218Z226_9HELO|nr:hypothetical protein JHW43_004047 [Diplocarpon mali]OWP01792.1 hypothetical protein B2J93_486 [Marssonina coronariae]
MASNNQQTQPDLASILRTLAGLTPQTQPQPNATYGQAPSHFEQRQQPWPLQPERIAAPPHSITPTDPLPKTGIDPATIIEWSAGLRCVMITVARHEGMLNDIRRMMKVQREHEEQWWHGRKILIEKQKARQENQKKLDDVLKAVGGVVTGGFSNNSPDELAKELGTFDIKVYKAQLQMVKEMNARLRSLGVPFFGTRSDLVRPVGKENATSSKSSDPEAQKGMIDEAELVKLQRKMLKILEDLCSD